MQLPTSPHGQITLLAAALIEYESVKMAVHAHEPVGVGTQGSTVKCSFFTCISNEKLHNSALGNPAEAIPIT
jgi:hypothetical protein